MSVCTTRHSNGRCTNCGRLPRNRKRWQRTIQYESTHGGWRLIQVAHSYRVQRLDYVPGYLAGRKVWIDVQKIAATWAKHPMRVMVHEEAQAATSALARRVNEYKRALAITQQHVDDFTADIPKWRQWAWKILGGK